MIHHSPRAQSRDFFNNAADCTERHTEGECIIYKCFTGNIFRQNISHESDTPNGGEECRHVGAEGGNEDFSSIFYAQNTAVKGDCVDTGLAGPQHDGGDAADVAFGAVLLHYLSAES